MELTALLTILDASDLKREVIGILDGDGITYKNDTGETLTATVDGDDYDDLIQVCLFEQSDSVKLYLNSVTRFKLDKFDLEDVSSFSIS
jgi:hypothetical protein